MAEDKNYSALYCLQRLFAQFRRNINFTALLTDELKSRFTADELGTVLDVANANELRPERCESLSEIAKSYRAPSMLKLTNGSWILVVNTGHVVTGDRVVIYDPAVNTPDKMLTVKTEQLLERATDVVVIFRNLQEVDIQKQSALFCLCSIARHHQVNMDIRRVMHEYAIDENEPRENLLAEIARDYNFRTRRTTYSWTKLTSLNQAYPLIGFKKNGKCFIICGIRRNEKDETELVTVDPEKQTESGQFAFLSRAEFEDMATGKVMLIKKIYRLSDEERPFGLGWFVPEFIKLRGIFGQIALTVGMITIISLVVPLFFQIVVDKVLVNKSIDTLNVIGIGILCAVIFNGVLEYLKSYFLIFATNKIDISTATKTFRHLMRLPIDFFERIPSGVLLKHMQQTEKIRGFLSGNLFFTILDIFSLIIFIPFLMLYSMQLTFIVLGFSALMAIVIATLIKPFQRRLNELYQAEGKRQSMLVESLHGVKTVKALSLEPVEEKQWDDTTAYAIKSYFKVGKISMTARSISHVIELMMTVTVIWAGAHLVFSNSISVGALIAFQMLAGRVTGPLVKLVGLIHEYQQIALSVKMLGVVMNTPMEPMGGGVRNPLRGDVAFGNVSFQYRPDLPAVIKNFSVDVPQGATIGIVGRSGSGKTTITKLLQGMYSVQQGIIRIDGIDIREIDKTHLRSSIGVVLQENYFFSGTVKDNISLTKRSATLEEIIYASKLAGADEFVQKLPRGYDTFLEENASNLSGGQKQRLAIARALLANPPILIFDEATSALDPESEHVIQQNLKSIAKGRTVFIVSHRLSIVSHSDMILVLDDGERSALGTHEQLMQQP